MVLLQKFFRLNHYQFSNTIALLLYKVAFDLLYIYVVSPIYDYEGFYLRSELYRCIISYLVFLLMIKPIVKLLDKQQCSSILLLIMNLIYFIPGCTLYSFRGFSDTYFLYFVLYWVLLMVFYYKCPVIKLKMPDTRSRWTLFYVIILFVVIASILITGVYNGFNLHLTLEDVYKLRAEQAEMNLPLLVRYMQPLASTIIPISIIYFLIAKKRMWVTILFVIQLLLFSFGAHKSTLFIIFVAILIYMFYKPQRLYWLIWGCLALIFISFIEMNIYSFSFLSMFFFNRVCLLPALLGSEYYNFFSNAELLYWRESILRWLGAISPYDEPTPKIIGYLYSGRVDVYANTGLCGDAYSQFGWFSLLIFPLLIILMLKLFDACSRGLDIRIVFVSCVAFALGFTNGSFWGLMLTNGFIVTCLFLYLMPRKLKQVLN